MSTPSPWKRVFDLVDARVSPVINELARSQDVAVLLALGVRAQREIERRAEQLSRRALHLLNLPAGVVPVTRVRSSETRRSDPADRIDARAAKIDEGSEGLPVGVQIVGRPFREDVILALMIAVEKHARLEADFPVTPIAPSSQTKSR